jgi:hypothetical protein
MRTLIVMVLLILTVPLEAQEIPGDSLAAVQGYAPGGPTPPAATAAEPASSDPKAAAVSLVLPVRSDNQLQQSLSVAEADLRRAQARLAWLSEAGSKRTGLSETKASKDQKRWSERLTALGTAQLSAARQACLVALAKQQALELELQLNQKRTERASSTGDPGASEGLKPVIRELERQTLEAQLKYRKLAHELASTEQDVADQRIALYKAVR